VQLPLNAVVDDGLDVRITLLTWKIPLRRCLCHLPLRRNRRSLAIGSNPIFAVLP